MTTDSCVSFLNKLIGLDETYLLTNSQNIYLKLVMFQRRLLPFRSENSLLGVTTVVAAESSESSSSSSLAVPWTKTVLGTRIFVVAGSLVWNSLPANIRSVSVYLQTFAWRPKTYLFELLWAQLRTVYFALEKWTNYYYYYYYFALVLHSPGS